MERWTKYLWNTKEEYLTSGLWVLKTTPSFSDLPEGLTELWNAVRLTIMVYYHERLQIKISKGKGCVEWNPGKTRHELPMSSLRGVIWTVLYSSTSEVWQHVTWGTEHCHQGSSPEPWYPEAPGSQSRRLGILPHWPYTQSSAPPAFKKWSVSQVPYKSLW